jgi:hypothetical protein
MRVDSMDSFPCLSKEKLPAAFRRQLLFRSTSAAFLKPISVVGQG